MRYYRIDITRPDGSVYLFKSLAGFPLTSLLPNGNANPGALNIELDIPVYNLADPDNNAWLRVWGLGLQDIGNASDLNGMSVAVYAGMSKGLPLANPTQAGLIMQGTIFQAFGNWVGTDQTVDLNFIAGGNVGSAAKPGNFPFAWQAGTPLAVAVAQTLTVAAPGLKQQISISPNLVLGYDVTGWYQSAQQFASFVNGLSASLIGGSYAGVSIATNGQTFRVFDGTASAADSAVKKIAFTDMIGQPTWIDAGTVSVKLAMRADLHVGDTISIPPSLFTVTQQALLSLQDRSAFSGNYQVQQVHHYGNFRQADAASWNTTVQVTPGIVN